VTQRALRFSAPRGGINKDGYRIYKLTLPSGEKRTFRVHRLVCEAWHGRPPTEKHQVVHWDGNKANNHFGNLRWATPQENSVRQGIDPVGVRNGRAKSSEADVREIRATYKGGYRNFKKLCGEYGLSSSGMRSVVNGGNWSHVGR